MNAIMSVHRGGSYGVRELRVPELMSEGWGMMKKTDQNLLPDSLISVCLCSDSLIIGGEE